MKKLLITLLFLSSCFVVKAQQEPVYSQYMFNTLAINPAYAGARDVLSITGLFRNQWVGIDAAPVSQTLSSDFALMDKKVGLGFQMYSDKLGVTSNTGFFTSYAYRMKLSKQRDLAFGLQVGVTQFRADLATVKLQQTTTAYDNAFGANINEVSPNVGAGVFYNTPKMYLGFSMPHILNNNLTRYSKISSTSAYKHIFFAGGYVITLNEHMVMKPSFLLKAVKSAPIQLDVNVNMWFYNTFSFGLSYRTEDAVVAMLEMQLNNQLRFGYAFDFTTSVLNNYTTGSHELMVRYEFGYKKKRMLSPRYF